MLVHGHRRVEADEDIEFERASRRGRKKRQKRWIREDFDVAAQRLQDMTNAFGARASPPLLDTNVFGIFSTYL